MSRVGAGKRAWATGRENGMLGSPATKRTSKRLSAAERTRKLSDAALKAWVTRRRKEAADPAYARKAARNRRRGARKAWETRRARA